MATGGIIPSSLVDTLKANGLPSDLNFRSNLYQTLGLGTPDEYKAGTGTGESTVKLLTHLTQNQDLLPKIAGAVQAGGLGSLKIAPPAPAGPTGNQASPSSAFAVPVKPPAPAPTTTGSTDVASRLADAIRIAESGGASSPTPGASGEVGSYQIMPDTWKGWSADYLKSQGQQGGSLAQTDENQRKVVLYQINKQLALGKTPEQIASWYNSGKYDPTGNVGVNKAGVAYNTPRYVQKVMAQFGKTNSAGSTGASPTGAVDFQGGNGGSSTTLPTSTDEINKMQADFMARYKTDSTKADSLAATIEGTKPKSVSDIIGQMNEVKNSLGITALEDQYQKLAQTVQQAENDIRTEAKASGGVVTESQIKALAAERTKDLQPQMQMLSDKLAKMYTMQTAVQNALQTSESDAAARTSKLLDYYKGDADKAYQAVFDYYKENQSTMKDMLKTQQENAKSMMELSVKYPGAGIILAGPNADNLAAAYTKAAKVAQSTEELDTLLKKAQLTKLMSEAQGKGLDDLVIQSQTRSIDGVKYVNMGDFPDTASKKAALTYAANNNIPVVQQKDGAKLEAIDNAQTNIKKINDAIQGLVSTHKGLNVLSGLNNSFQDFIGNENVKSFNAWRTSVINNVQALAGGEGSGLRINQAEIDTALKNDLPTIEGAHADTLASAQKKLQTLQDQMNTWKETLLRQTRGSMDQQVTDNGDRVQVISPDGKVGTIPKSQLDEALKGGYKQK